MKKLQVIRSGKSEHTHTHEHAHSHAHEHPTTPSTTRGSSYWRSLETKGGVDDAAWREFPEDADKLEIPADGVSRRRFFGLMGSGAALAGIASSTTGCIRKPKENILPFTERPEDMIPGQALHYSSAFQIGDTVEGILVESQDGRPMKIEGNPKHPGSQGGTNVLAQASVLDLYDPDRSRTAVVAGAAVPLSGPLGPLPPELEAGLSGFSSSGGQGLALVLPLILSPTERSLLADIKRRLPNVRVFLDDAFAPLNSVTAAEKIGGPGARYRYSMLGAKVVFSADCNFFGFEPDATRLSREWSRARRIVKPEDEMSRVYYAEPTFTTAGAMADHRVRLRSADMGEALLVLAHELAGTARGPVDLASLPQGTVDETAKQMLAVLAKDLIAAGPGQSVILVGERQPAWVHELGLAINAALGNVDRTVRWVVDPTAPAMEPLSALAEGLRAGAITSVFAIGTNPAYDGGGDLGLAELLAASGVTLWHAGLYRDETGAAAALHLPLSHDLEAWGDVQGPDGTVTVRQPLIEPLHGSVSRTELFAWLASGQWIDGYSLIKGQWMQFAGAAFTDAAWRKWLHDGVVTERPGLTAPTLAGWAQVAADVSSRPAPIPADAWEVNLVLDAKVGDGRFANNVWLQEAPEPMTKIVWDNAALISNKSAKALGVGIGDLVTVSVDGRQITIPVFIAPGQVDQTITISLGYGRRILPHHENGKAAVTTDGAGFNAYPLRSAANPWFAAGQVSVAGGRYRIVTTQDYGLMKPTTGNETIDATAYGTFPERPIVLEATREDYSHDPDFVDKANLMPQERLQHLWDPPKLEGLHQWGMSIDLNLCNGCNVCVVACQAENNIPVVGKEQVGNNREMHWVRIDRYFRGDEDNPTAVLQPMACQHCESAPCETVCPVAATVHSPEGLNEMTYNRCIGTRYCSNNCPYKVRRFNFFNYNTNLRPSTFWNEDTDGAWLRQMQKNQNVTIRFRGVMEKCTYCVQRINQAKIAAHVRGTDVIEDGEIKSACSQVCPTGAVVFGNIADPKSRVSIAKRSSRDYSVLSDLNVHPRTTYLARIRNVHPDLPRPIPDLPGHAAPAHAPEAGHGAHGEGEHGAHAENQPHPEHGGH